MRSLYLRPFLSTSLAYQVSRIQSVHDKSLIYRDIKPDNFLIGVPSTKNANIIHLIGTFPGSLSPVSFGVWLDFLGTSHGVYVHYPLARPSQNVLCWLPVASVLVLKADSGVLTCDIATRRVDVLLLTGGISKV